MKVRDFISGGIQEIYSSQIKCGFETDGGVVAVQSTHTLITILPAIWPYSPDIIQEPEIMQGLFWTRLQGHKNVGVSWGEFFAHGGTLNFEKKLPIKFKIVSKSN